MQLKRYIFAALLTAIGSVTATAQTAGVDELPSRPAAQRIVREAAAVSETPAATAAKAATAGLATNAQGEAIVKTALQYLGARYRSGHSGPTAFDCSGFTSFVYKRENIGISRSSRTQYQEGTPIADISNLQKGDLVFFGGSRGSRNVGHVGIVTDVDPTNKSFKFVHAARTGVQVDDSSAAYYSRRYIGARRIVNE